MEVLVTAALQLSSPLIIEALHTSGLYPTLTCLSNFTHVSGYTEAIRVLMYVSVCYVWVESFPCSVKYS